MIIGAAILVVILIPIVWRLITPLASIDRYIVAAPAPDGCRAEAWVKGVPGDELVRLFNTRKRRPPIYKQTIIRHEKGTSLRLPDRVKTTAGNCYIAKYHLLIDNQERDSMTVPNAY